MPRLCLVSRRRSSPVVVVFTLALATASASFAPASAHAKSAHAKSAHAKSAHAKSAHAKSAHAKSADGTTWVSVDLPTALARAKRAHKRVLIKFEASWCGPCRRLANEVFHSPAGARLTRDMIAVKVDFDAPENRPYIERYVVLGLPTTVVVTPDGEQVLRIMGYDGKAAFERVLATAGAAIDPVPALRKRWQVAPADDANRLALGKALLVRGAAGGAADGAVQREALSLLEALLWRPQIDPPTGGKPTGQLRKQRERAAEVLFTLGRYHHRVRRDPATAQHLWRELATRFGDTSWAGGAWWWFARSQAELGRVAVGRDVLRQRALHEPNNADALSQWISFATKHHLVGDRRELLVVAANRGTGAAALTKRARAISAPAAAAATVK